MAVSAPVGGGKTSLVRGLAQTMDGVPLHFDHYERLTQSPLEEVKAWLHFGAEIADLSIPRLADDLKGLKHGSALADPATGAVMQPTQLVFFETPFARCHRESGNLIDLAIWIDTPLDVALARNLQEFMQQPELRTELSSWLPDYLDGYLDAVRDMLLMQQEAVGGAADITLDGTADLATNISVAEMEIRRLLKNRASA